MREHSEAIKPPRTLWVSFPLGRPLGAPHQPEFQRRVLESALGLLERVEGPVLEDFPDDEPSGSDEDGPWACPLPLAAAGEPATEDEALRQQLQSEVSRLRPWYDEAVEKHGRTAVGVTGLDVDSMPELAGVLTAAALDEPLEAPSGAATPLPGLLRFAADDLKAYYMEAAAAQPAATPASIDDMDRWLFGQTRLGETLYRARDTLMAKEEAPLKMVGRFMIPAAYWKRPTN